jgi:hypothetical protein
VVVDLVGGFVLLVFGVDLFFLFLFLFLFLLFYFLPFSRANTGDGWLIHSAGHRFYRG